MVFPSLSASHFVSVTPSMDILFPPSKDVSIPILAFLLLEFYVFGKLYLGYSELLGQYPLISECISYVF